jgi:hypothetical protein
MQMVCIIPERLAVANIQAFANWSTEWRIILIASRTCRAWYSGLHMSHLLITLALIRLSVAATFNHIRVGDVLEVEAGQLVLFELSSIKGICIEKTRSLWHQKNHRFPCPLSWKKCKRISRHHPQKHLFRNRAKATIYNRIKTEPAKTIPLTMKVLVQAIAKRLSFGVVYQLFSFVHKKNPTCPLKSTWLSAPDVELWGFLEFESNRLPSGYTVVRRISDGQYIQLHYSP